MDFSGYTVIMLKTFFGKWLLFLLMLFLCVLFEFTCGRSDKKMTKAERKSIEDISVMHFFLLIFVVIFCLYESLPILKDCIGKDYTTVYGEYTTESAPASKTGGRTHWVIITSDDGTKIELEYPRGTDLSELPDEPCYGTAWYSERSHYILEFIPDEPINGN